jgi:membrane protease YdiL (CAAX protease family)
MGQSSIVEQESSVTHLSLLARRPIISYFGLTYLISWLLWLPLILSKDGGIGLLPFSTGKDISSLAVNGWILLGSLGPVASAFIMSAVTGGKSGVKQLLLRMVRVKVGVQWYLIALFLPLLVIVLLSVIADATGFLPRLFSLQSVLALAAYILATAVGIVIGSPLLEEPGWRGFALPRMQVQMGPLKASLVLGLLWACWHLPLAFFTVWGQPYRIGGNQAAFLLYIVVVTCYTITMTWLYNNSRGSVFIAMLFHSAVNDTAVFLLMIYPEQIKNFGQVTATPSEIWLTFLIDAGIWLIICGIVLALTHGRLSFRPKLFGDDQEGIHASLSPRSDLRER